MVHLKRTVTAKQLAANCAALKSTGRRTTAGQWRSSLDATRTGPSLDFIFAHNDSIGFALALADVDYKGLTGFEDPNADLAKSFILCELQGIASGKK